MLRYFLALMALVPLFSGYCHTLTVSPRNTPIRLNAHLFAINYDARDDRSATIVSYSSKPGQHIRDFQPAYNVSQALRFDMKTQGIRLLFEPGTGKNPGRSYTSLMRDPVIPPGDSWINSQRLNLSLFENRSSYELQNSRFVPEKKQRSGFGRGAAIGAIVGGSLGLIVGFASSGGNPEYDFVSPIATVVTSLVVGAAIGALLGGIIGFATKKRKPKY